jgi:hypothetical protein
VQELRAQDEGVAAATFCAHCSDIGRLVGGGFTATAEAETEAVQELKESTGWGAAVHVLIVELGGYVLAEAVAEAMKRQCRSSRRAQGEAVAAAACCVHRRWLHSKLVGGCMSAKAEVVAEAIAEAF